MKYRQHVQCPSVLGRLSLHAASLWTLQSGRLQLKSALIAFAPSLVQHLLRAGRHSSFPCDSCWCQKSFDSQALVDTPSPEILLLVARKKSRWADSRTLRPLDFFSAGALVIRSRTIGYQSMHSWYQEMPALQSSNTWPEMSWMSQSVNKEETEQGDASNNRRRTDQGLCTGKHTNLGISTVVRRSRGTKHGIEDAARLPATRGSGSWSREHFWSYQNQL